MQEKKLINVKFVEKFVALHKILEHTLVVFMKAHSNVIYVEKLYAHLNILQFTSKLFMNGFLITNVRFVVEFLPQHPC